MTTQEVKRKLTAILSADVKGYSRLMGEDEEWTVHTLNIYKDMMRGLIQQHRGRIVDAPGDNVLAEFASVVDAVQCAVEVQQVLRAKNAMLPENRRMEFRIGINLGDVIEEGEQIYGDGVNIAARLEGLAEAGGICISESAYQQIENKLPLRYDYLGEHEVKNIAKPVRAYRARIESETAPSKLGTKKPFGKRLSNVTLGIIAVVVIAGAITLYQIVPHPSPFKTEVASEERMAFPLPDKPSIAVLPFVNMSEDPKKEFFSDGLTEEIISALSKSPKLFVIARNSTFTYKGKSTKVQEVSEALGVRYVLEGSVRWVGDRVRITAQLIDALTGNHLWSERYEKPLGEIFAVQDEITLAIVRGMRVSLTEGEQARLIGKGTKNLDAYLKAVQGHEQFLLMNRQGSMKAKEFAREAIALDPKYAYPYSIMANAHMLDVWFRFTESPEKSMRLADDAAHKALALDDTDPYIHGSLTNLYVMQKQHVKAIASAERSLDLSPGSARSHSSMGVALSFACRFSEAVPFFEQAIRLDPYPPATAFRLLGAAYSSVGRHEEALTAFNKALKLNPNDIFIHLALANLYVSMGREEEARTEAREVLRLHPKFSLDHYAKTLAFKDQSFSDHVVERLRKAGLK